MILRKYGIELHSLCKEDLELVHQWRNDAYIQSSMFFQESISFADHLNWFEGLDNTSLYLVIVYRSRQIGIINVKGIDWHKRSGEAGIFIGEPSYRNTYLSILAILALMDICFDDFHFSKLTATVRSDNEKALRMNLDIGYQIVEEHDDRLLLSVTADKYRKKRESFKPILTKFNAHETELSLNSEEKACYLDFRK